MKVKVLIHTSLFNTALCVDTENPVNFQTPPKKFAAPTRLLPRQFVTAARYFKHQGCSLARRKLAAKLTNTALSILGVQENQSVGRLLMDCSCCKSDGKLPPIQIADRYCRLLTVRKETRLHRCFPLFEELDKTMPVETWCKRLANYLKNRQTKIGARQGSGVLYLGVLFNNIGSIPLF